MEEKLSLDDILGDFSTQEQGPGYAQTRRCVTIWLSPDDWLRYDRLQRKSKKQFGKRARDALMALIRLAEARSA